jgi:3-phosphoshikimate 1-carboxyvinyltransferase
MGKACLPYKSVVVVGLGLIGGSVAKGLRHRFPGLEVIGVDPAEATLQAALGDSAITRAYPTLPRRLEKGSLIVLATGLNGILKALEDLDGAVLEGVWLTDVTGLKRRVVALVEQLGGNLARAYVGSHPMSGREVRGYAASMPDLFAGYPVFLTGCSFSEEEAYARLTAFWRALGGVVHRLEPVTHDRVVAWISHLPHVLSFVLKRTIAEEWPGPEGASKAEGSGLQGMLRIAHSDPNIWSELMIENRDFTLEALDAFLSKIHEVKESLLDGSLESLAHSLTPANSRKEKP